MDETIVKANASDEDEIMFIGRKIEADLST